ncbi:hypothetical protein N9X61_01255 [Sulfurimonas sp.]|nr:hypothetical protein [Sulfurimonas sp.]
MRLHQKFIEEKTQLMYEVLWFSDYNKLVFIVNKVSPTSIPKMLSLDTFYNDFIPKND